MPEERVLERDPSVDLFSDPHFGQSSPTPFGPATFFLPSSLHLR